jgi:arylformamidase
MEVDIGEEALRKFKPRKNEIIVLKTRNSERGFEKFRPDFVHVTVDGASYLAKCGIAAVGIDSLGIQKFHSGNMKVHEAFLSAGIPIFEGLNLKGVPAGGYFFVGLPLKIEAEAAPARVVLIKGLKA